MPPARPRRSRLGPILGVAIAFILLGVVILQNRDKLAAVFARPVAWRFLAAGMGVYLGALLLTFGRWQQLVRAQGIAFPFRDAVRLGFIGNLFNLVIPGAVGGDVIKAAYLGRMRADRKPEVWASMVLDRLLGLLGLFLLAGGAGAVTWPSAGSGVRALIGIVGGAIAAGLVGLGVVFSPGAYRPLHRLARGRPRLARVVAQVEAIGRAYRARIGLVAAMLALATTIHALFVVAFYLASRAILADIPTLAQHYLMVPLVLFTTAVPLPFGAMGVSEEASQALFALVHHHDGVIAMMAFRVLMYGNGIVSALVYLANLGQARSLARDAGIDDDLSVDGD